MTDFRTAAFICAIEKVGLAYLRAGRVPLIASLVVAAHLVVFQQDGSLAAYDFAKKALPQIRSLAAARGITLELRDAKAGAPAEVHTTPLLVYQDAAGRSIYRGRPTELDRIGQFLRTVRAGPLANAEIESENVAVWRRGRAAVIAPIKVTPLSGTIPARFDEAAFAAGARRAILSGFTRFRSERKIATGPSDRAFYMDFHPYRDPSGKLFVSTAIYSGFNCVEPVFSGFAQPVSGAWEDQLDVFARAGKLLEDRVVQIGNGSEIGDAYDPVERSVPLSSWSALGLALPAAAPSGARAPVVAVALPRRLVVAGALADDPPRLEFRFAPPLDSYNGEVRVLSGTIVLGDRSRLRGATGTLEAATASVTMGNKMLDAELRNSMLRADAFPVARFVLDPGRGGRRSARSRRFDAVHCDGAPRDAGSDRPDFGQGAGGARTGRGRIALARRAGEVRASHRRGVRPEGA